MILDRRGGLVRASNGGASGGRCRFALAPAGAGAGRLGDNPTVRHRLLHGRERRTKAEHFPDECRGDGLLPVAKGQSGDRCLWRPALGMLGWRSFPSRFTSQFSRLFVRFTGLRNRPASALEIPTFAACSTRRGLGGWTFGRPSGRDCPCGHRPGMA